MYGMAGRSISTGRKCGLDSSLLLIGRAVMSSRLLPRRGIEGGTFSFSCGVCLFSLSSHRVSATLSCCDVRRLDQLSRLLDLRGIGMGSVGSAGGCVAALAGCCSACAFSVRGCLASSLVPLRRRFLKGQIGMLCCHMRAGVSHPAAGLWRAAGWTLEGAQKEQQSDTKACVKACETVYRVAQNGSGFKPAP